MKRHEIGGLGMVPSGRAVIGRLFRNKCGCVCAADGAVEIGNRLTVCQTATASLRALPSQLYATISISCTQLGSYQKFYGRGEPQ
ncbi:hypothetical protein TNCV_1626271 [Trichonephila clavipes]|nr:hypothetical protein TNCV_1626271 [Trichonephila clavipes]